MSKQVRTELVHHEGCPLAEAAREVLHASIQEVGIDVVVVDRIARYPSPSILVDGVDVMGAPADEVCLDACRLDPPTRDRVVAALRSAAPRAR